MNEEEFKHAQAYAQQLAKETVARIRRAREESNVRQRLPVTQSELPGLQDSELTQRIAERLNFLADEGMTGGVSPPQQAVAALVQLDGEISNGGFHQYFWNTQADGLDELLEDAAVLDGSAAHAIIAEAIARARQYSYRRSWLMRRSRWWWQKQFEKGYTQKRFEDLDDRYEALSPSVTELLGKFIRQNSTAFVEVP